MRDRRARQTRRAPVRSVIDRKRIVVAASVCGVELPDAADAARIGPGDPNRPARTRVASPASPMPISTGRCAGESLTRPRRSSGRQSLSRRRLHGDLDDVRAGRAHRRARAVEVGRHAVEVVRRQDDALRAVRQRGRRSRPATRRRRTRRRASSACSQQPAPLVFGALELPAFPRRPAGDDDRPAAARERASHVRIADRVEAQLDQVGVGDGVAPPAQFGRRRRGHGDAEKRSSHVTGPKKKPLQPVG